MRRSAQVLPLAVFLSSLLLAACGTVDYRDTTAEVDARAQCTGMDEDEPGTVLPDWCERTSTATWRVGEEEMPAPDFGDDEDEDD